MRVVFSRCLSTQLWPMITMNHLKQSFCVVCLVFLCTWHTEGIGTFPSQPCTCNTSGLQHACNCTDQVILSCKKGFYLLNNSCEQCDCGITSPHASCHCIKHDVNESLSCQTGFYLSHGNCKSCDCNNVTSVDTSCNKTNGQCPCKTNIIGRQCNGCMVTHTPVNSSSGSLLNCVQCAINHVLIAKKTTPFYECVNQNVTMVTTSTIVSTSTAMVPNKSESVMVKGTISTSNVLSTTMTPSVPSVVANKSKIPVTVTSTSKEQTGTQTLVAPVNNTVSKLKTTSKVLVPDTTKTASTNTIHSPTTTSMSSPVSVTILSPSNNVHKPTTSSPSTITPLESTSMQSRSTSIPSRSTSIPSRSTSIQSGSTSIQSRITSMQSKSTSIQSGSTSVPPRSTSVLPKNTSTSPSHTATQTTTLPSPSSSSTSPPTTTDVVPPVPTQRPTSKEPVTGETTEEPLPTFGTPSHSEQSTGGIKLLHDEESSGVVTIVLVSIGVFLVLVIAIAVGCWYLRSTRKPSAPFWTVELSKNEDVDFALLDPVTDQPHQSQPEEMQEMQSFKPIGNPKYCAYI